MKRLLATIAVVAVGWVAQQAGFDLNGLTRGQSSMPTGTSAPDRPAPSAPRDAQQPGSWGPGSLSAGAARIEEALAGRESGFMVTVDAEVKKTLPDDLKGSRHQRFLIELETGRSILIAHNIDLADRVPLERGDTVRIRGQFEWNEKGGVLHWTHHDPKGRHEGGWIEHSGRRVE